MTAEKLSDFAWSKTDQEVLLIGPGFSTWYQSYTAEFLGQFGTVLGQFWTATLWLPYTLVEQKFEDSH
jgi:hypothetical protein